MCALDHLTWSAAAICTSMSLTMILLNGCGHRGQPKSLLLFFFFDVNDDASYSEPNRTTDLYGNITIASAYGYSFKCKFWSDYS